MTMSIRMGEMTILLLELNSSNIKCIAHMIVGAEDIYKILFTVDVLMKMICFVVVTEYRYSEQGG